MAENTGYSKSQAAKSLGITTKELEKRAKDAGFDNTEEYWNSIGGSSAPLIEAISKQMVEYDRQLEELSPYLSLTDEEKQAFLDKALVEITPYYDKKTAEIQAGIQEGKLRTAEDILSQTREIEQEISNQLASFDLSQAKTEEEFVNKLADITATKDEDLTQRRLDFQQRMEIMKSNQIQSGVLTSGIGAKKRAESTDIENLAQQALERRSQASATALETAKKYTIDQIELARKGAEEERIRKIGSPEEAAATRQSAMGTLGISDISQLPSEKEITRLRSERNVTPITGTTSLTDLEEEKARAREATAQELQADELSRRESEYGMTRDQILAERAKKASQISALRGY